MVAAARARVVVRLLAAVAAMMSVASAAPAGAASPGTAQPVPGALLHARLSAQRREAYLQEVFEFTVSVYSRGVTMGREIALRNVEAPGLRYFPYADRGTTREQVDGKLFEVRRFRGRAQAVATGAFTLQPEVTASVVVRERGAGPAGRAEVRETLLRPDALAVTVLPLPEGGRPEGFGGAVGSFTFAAAVAPAAVAAGEPVTVTMEIEGAGNVESIAPPRVAGGERFLVYEPRLVKREIAADGARGRLVFEQAAVPRSAASTPLPAVTFSFFDPAARAYRRVDAGPFPLQVRPAARAEAIVVDAGPAGAARVRPALGPEIAPLKPAPGRWAAPAARPWHASPWFLALQLVPLAAAAGLLVAARRREALARDVARSRRHLAPDAARSRLAAARAALRQGSPARFHDALWGALAAYFANRLNLLPGQVSRQVVATRLAGAGLDTAALARLEGIFDFSEQERFGRPPSASRLSAEEAGKMAALLDELDALLESCERLAP